MKGDREIGLQPGNLPLKFALTLACTVILYCDQGDRQPFSAKALTTNQSIAPKCSSDFALGAKLGRNPLHCTHHIFAAVKGRNAKISLTRCTKARTWSADNMTAL